MTPSKPPPPNITTLEFQSFGNATWNSILLALASTGMILPDTKQYSSTHCAVVTTPPRVGKAIDAAGIFLPDSCEHCGSLSGPASTALHARTRTAVQTLCMLMILISMLELLR